MNHHSIPIPTFSWAEPWDSHWNQLMSKFVYKHWTHALSHGAFVNFPFNPSENIPTSFFFVLRRWFMGKSTALQRNSYTPESMARKAYQVKKSKWRKQVSFFLCFHHLHLTQLWPFIYSCPEYAQMFSPPWAYHLNRLISSVSLPAALTQSNHPMVPSTGYPVPGDLNISPPLAIILISYMLHTPLKNLDEGVQGVLPCGNFVKIVTSKKRSLVFPHVFPVIAKTLSSSTLSMKQTGMY